MTKLTTELLEKFVSDIKTDGMCDITDHQVALALRQLLAYEQAAKNPAAKIKWDGSEFSVTNVSSDFYYGTTDVYLAPVLPKQPEPKISFYRDGIIAAAKWVENQRDAYDNEHGQSDPDTGAFEFGNDAQLEYSTTLSEIAEGIRSLHPASAQPVSEPYKLNSWISVADRLPSEFGRYLCYVEEQNDLGKSHYQWNCSWNGDVFSDSALTGRVTHWMPLPEPPAQESE